METSNVAKAGMEEENKVARRFSLFLLSALHLGIGMFYQYFALRSSFTHIFEFQEANWRARAEPRVILITESWMNDGVREL